MDGVDILLCLGMSIMICSGGPILLPGAGLPNSRLDTSMQVGVVSVRCLKTSSPSV